MGQDIYLVAEIWLLNLIILFLSIWALLYNNFSIKHLNHFTSAWLIGLSISLQFLMQGKVGGYASVFEKYEEKAESFMWNPLNISTSGFFALK